jgi:hypothetical protein
LLTLMLYRRLLQLYFTKTMKSMQRWLRNYERIRTEGLDRQFKMPSSWHSTKYPLETMTWDEIREIYVPEMQMTFGKCCESIRKSWYHYKMARKEGDKAWDIILRIARIERALGLEMIQFRDGPPVEWVKQQLDMEEGTGVESSSEDLELKYEENQGQLWGDDEPLTTEERQLMAEEREDLIAQIEADEW